MPIQFKLKLALLGAERTQRSLAKACDIPENRFSEIMRGWIDPRPDEQRAIAAALGKSVAELFEPSEDERCEDAEPSPDAAA